MLAAALIASASIFHGTPLPPDQAPWLVTLTTRGPFCGGALIAPDRVLTAAHCVAGADPNRVRVRIRGVRHAWRGARFPTTYREIPSPVDPHNASASGTVDDLAVIELSKPVTNVPPLPLAQPAPALGEATLTVGTGRTGPDGGGGGAPRSAAQNVSGDCPAAYGANLFDAAKHLCTLDATANASQACAGDSGSPVMVRRNGAWAVAGVVTWGGETYGRDCGEGLPDVSERVDAHTALLNATGAYAPTPSGASVCGAPARRAAACSVRGPARTRRSRCAGTAWPSHAPKAGSSATASRCTSTTPGARSPTPRAASAAR